MLTGKAYALSVQVFRTDRLGDCTNDGASSKFDNLLVLVNNRFDGNTEVDLSNPPANLFTLETNDFGPYRGLKLVPYIGKPGFIGPMFGGNVAGCSDARWTDLIASKVGKPNKFLADYVPIHDRFEDERTYELNSH